jgi:release factor glutamine methyltransferase
VAQKSAQKHGVKVEFLQGDLLEPLQTSGFRTQDCIILANLPYVPDSHTVNDAAQQEPKIAIFGGPDGLDLYRKLFQQINTKPNRPKYVLTESLPFQHKELTKIAADSRYRLAQTDDFIQVFEAIPEVKLQA